jgi:DNA repair exonuclease SbcCD ATPase subunit
MKTPVKESANNVSVPVDRIIGFERSISEKDQTIGVQKETITNLNKQIEELKKQKEAVTDDQKVAVMKEIEGKSKARCKACGYDNPRNETRNNCYNCGSTLGKNKQGLELVEYRNLDSVVEEIRKEESKKLGVDNVALTEKLNSAELENKQLVNEIKRVEGLQEEELTNAKRDVRERYQKEVDGKQRKINELVLEIHKLEENKTDEEAEEARKQEIIDLKTMIDELKAQIEESKKIPRLAKYWQRVAARSETRKAEAEKEAKKDRVEEISNKYPKTATPNKKKWWNKGKYAKKESMGDVLNDLVSMSYPGIASTSYNPW